MTLGKPSAFGGEHRRELGVTWQAADRELDTGHEVRAIEMDRARHGRLIEPFLWPKIDDQQVLVAEMRLELVRLHNQGRQRLYLARSTWIGARTSDHSAAADMPAFSTRAAQNLNSGILPTGSSAGLVSILAAASA